MRAGPDAFRVTQQHLRVGRQHVDQEFQAVDQDRGKRFHAVDGVAGGDPVEHLTQVSGGVQVHPGQHRSPLANLVGEEQLAAGRGDDGREGLVERTLVGDGERPDLLDGVAEEVDPYRVLQGRREQVDDPAADAELAAALNEVDPHVRRVDKALRDVGDVIVLAGHQLHGHQVAQAGHLRLQHGPHRCDDHHRGRQRVVAREAAEDCQPSSDGVGPGAESFVRQRLPGRVVGNLVRAEQGRQCGRGCLGLAERRGDQQQRASRLAGERRDQQWADRLGDRDVEGGESS